MDPKPATGHEFFLRFGQRANESWLCRVDNMFVCFKA